MAKPPKDEADDLAVTTPAIVIVKPVPVCLPITKNTSDKRPRYAVPIYSQAPSQAPSPTPSPAHSPTRRHEYRCTKLVRVALDTSTTAKNPAAKNPTAAQGNTSVTQIERLSGCDKKASLAEYNKVKIMRLNVKDMGNDRYATVKLKSINSIANTSRVRSAEPQQKQPQPQHKIACKKTTSASDDDKILYNMAELRALIQREVHMYIGAEVRLNILANQKTPTTTAHLETTKKPNNRRKGRRQRKAIRRAMERAAETGQLACGDGEGIAKVTCQGHDNLEGKDSSTEVKLDNAQGDISVDVCVDTVQEAAASGSHESLVTPNSSREDAATADDDSN